MAHPLALPHAPPSPASCDHFESLLGKLSLLPPPLSYFQAPSISSSWVPGVATFLRHFQKLMTIRRGTEDILAQNIKCYDALLNHLCQGTAKGSLL
jgi:hypothetical protein